eukprot:Filipodium_phascolosomae@DN2835_c0_g1_i1.p1
MAHAFPGLPSGTSAAVRSVNTINMSVGYPNSAAGPAHPHFSGVFNHAHQQSNTNQQQQQQQNRIFNNYILSSGVPPPVVYARPPPPLPLQNRSPTTGTVCSSTVAPRQIASLSLAAAPKAWTHRNSTIGGEIGHGASSPRPTPAASSAFQLFPNVSYSVLPPSGVSLLKTTHNSVSASNLVTQTASGGGPQCTLGAPRLQQP